MMLKVKQYDTVLLKDGREAAIVEVFENKAFIAHKLTGQKGAEFTARYINRFYEMEQELVSPNSSEIPIGEVASYLKAKLSFSLLAFGYPNIILNAVREGKALTEIIWRY